MSREWKPGDVAALEIGGERVRGVVVASDSERPVWQIAGHTYFKTIAVGNNALIDNARPLVVIDPESVEDVERLTCLLAGRPITRGYGSSDVQATLREFADPKPRIEEPTGLGAVVADADGHKWTRANSQGEWFCECGDEVFTTWDEFTTATEVLSEGVTP